MKKKSNRIHQKYKSFDDNNHGLSENKTKTKTKTKLN